MKKVLFLLFVAAGIGLGATAANAHFTQCADAVSMERGLQAERWQEAVAWQGGNESTGTITKLWWNVETDTWTLVITYPNGNACVMGSGDKTMPAEMIEVEPEPEGDDT